MYHRMDVACPYSIPMRDSVHLKKCELKSGICSERDWKFEYHLCLLFLDKELEIKKEKEKHKT